LEIVSTITAAAGCASVYLSAAETGESARRHVKPQQPTMTKGAERRDKSGTIFVTTLNCKT